MRFAIITMMALALAASAAGAERPISDDQIIAAVTILDVVPHRIHAPGARNRLNGDLQQVADLCRKSPRLFAVLVGTSPYDLNSRLNDSDARVRAATVEILGRAGIDKALDPVIRKLFLDKHFDVRKRAARVLVAFGRPGIFSECLRPVVELSDKQVKAVRSGSHFASIEKALVDALAPSARLREYARSTDEAIADAARVELFALSRGDAEAAKRKRSRKGLRRELTTLLGAIRAKSAVEPLAELLAEGDEQLAVACCNALGSIGTSDAHAALVGALSSGTVAVRRTCLHLLNASGVAVDLPTLAKAIASEDVIMRRYAARGLGMHTDARSTRLLSAALGDRDSSVRRTAAVTLGSPGRSAGATGLAELFSMGERHDSRLAARSLAKIGLGRPDDPVAARLGRLVAKWAPQGRIVSGDRAIADLDEALGDTQWQVRCAAVRLAAGAFGIDASRRLAAALSDFHPSVRLAAAKAIGDVWRAGSGTDGVDRTRLGRDVADALLGAAAGGNERLAVLCYRSLATVRSTGIEMRLAGRLSLEKRPHVRDAIACALRRLTGRSFGPDADRWHRWLRAGSKRAAWGRTG